MKKKATLIVMLSGGTIASVYCIIMRVSLVDTIFIVLVALIIFTIVGSIAQKIFDNLNKSVEERLLAEQEAKKQEETRAIEEARELEEAEKLTAN